MEPKNLTLGAAIASFISSIDEGTPLSTVQILAAASFASKVMLTDPEVEDVVVPALHKAARSTGIAGLPGFQGLIDDLINGTPKKKADPFAVAWASLSGLSTSSESAMAKGAVINTLLSIVDLLELPREMIASADMFADHAEAAVKAYPLIVADRYGHAHHALVSELNAKIIAANTTAGSDIGSVARTSHDDADKVLPVGDDTVAAE